MLHERKLDTRDEPLRLIYNAARRVNDAAVRKVTLSIVERDKMYIQTDGGRF